jgi:hypothetical protein
MQSTRLDNAQQAGSANCVLQYCDSGREHNVKAINVVTILSSATFVEHFPYCETL